MTISLKIEFAKGELTASEQSLVSDGFEQHAEEVDAPQYDREHLKWLVSDERGDLRAVLTADVLWDWVCVDELWVDRDFRGQGIGKKLMQLAEEFARSSGLQGIWLWTQSWQAEGFYQRLGYSEFTRFKDFPKGHSRIGFRKILA